MDSPLSDDWREFLSLLISHRVKYLLVGGHALAVHGQPRVTFDLDVFVEASPTNARRIYAVLQAFGFGSVAPPLEELAAADRVFMLGQKPYRIDIRYVAARDPRPPSNDAGSERTETDGGQPPAPPAREDVAPEPPSCACVVPHQMPVGTQRVRDVRLARIKSPEDLN